MDIDIMGKQLADLMRRVAVLEGHVQSEHLSPEGVVQEMEVASAEEAEVKEIIAAHDQTARGAQPGGAATEAAGMAGVSSQVQVEPLTRDIPPASQDATFNPFAQAPNLTPVKR